MENTILIGTYIMILAVAFLCSFVPVIGCGVVASDKNRSVGWWIVGGFLFGWIAFIILLCQQPIPRKIATVQLKKEIKSYNCSQCGKEIFSVNCRYCGKRHPAKIGILPNDDKGGYWKCSCGQLNPIYTTECQNCYKRRG